MESKKVKLTNPTTCKMIYELTKAMAHYGKCPIIMPKSKWLLIRPYIRARKEADRSSGNGVMNTFNDVFGQFFNKK